MTVRLSVAVPRGEPRWARPALLGVLALAGFLYAWNLGVMGYANSYYSAAILSGTKSWKAFLFGSLDAGNFITVDKPPVAFWIMGLSTRIFGFNTWSMLLPEAVAGVASVGILYVTVRGAFRSLLGSSGAAVAGLVAGLVMALTPITVAINRDNNPDTMLVLFLVLAAWALQRDRLVLSMVFVGFAVNTKMFQGLVVLPALVATYLLCASPPFWRRVGRLALAGVALVVSSGWWMVLVDAIPAGRRPYVGSSTANSVWDLAIGYNGLGRVFGGNHAHHAFGGLDWETGRQFAMGATTGVSARHGGSGIGRFFESPLDGQISWLLPFAVIALVGGLVLLGRRPRTDRARAALLLWGLWLAVSYVVYSFSEGTFHPYYTTTMSPAIAALVGAGGVMLLPRWRWLVAAGVAITGVWAFVLLRRTPSWCPWLAWTVLALTILAALALLATGTGERIAILGRRGVAVQGWLGGAVVLALVGGLAGPAAYSFVPLNGKALSGNNPLAGPAGADQAGGLGGMRRFAAEFPGGQAPGGALPGGQAPGGALPGGQGPGGVLAGGGGSQGGSRGTVDAGLVDYLVGHRGSATWLVAVPSSFTAAPIILRTGKAVMAMGGFAGRDPAMTVSRMQRYVGTGRLRYVMLGGGVPASVSQWVTAHCTAIQVSATSLYRCA